MTTGVEARRLANPRKEWQAKRISDERVLDLLAPNPDERGYSYTTREVYAWLETYTHRGVPFKVVNAKLSSMARRGLIHGCGCGCGGHWHLSSWCGMEENCR